MKYIKISLVFLLLFSVILFQLATVQSIEEETTCETPVCDSGDATDTGEVDENGCAIYNCPPISSCPVNCVCDDDGKVIECEISSCPENCKCDDDGKIIECNKPVCGNGICEDGEAEICEVEEVICKGGETCESKKGKARCYVPCPEDCNILDGIYAKLNQKFKLNVGQPVKIVNYNDMKIRFVSVNYAEVAKLEVNLEEEPTKYILMKLGEKKEVFGVTLFYLDYYSKYRNGLFLVSKSVESCPEKCICSVDGTMECPTESECVEGTILCPDGFCREECKSLIGECKFGCLYGESCLPIGTRVDGQFCSLNRNLEKQLGSEKTCENNFECSSNLCIDGECIEPGFFKKVMSWFRKLFG